jgi:sRNA-binding carbon storage regulator CsrA
MSKPNSLVVQRRRGESVIMINTKDHTRIKVTPVVIKGESMVRLLFEAHKDEYAIWREELIEPND